MFLKALFLSFLVSVPMYAVFGMEALPPPSLSSSSVAIPPRTRTLTSPQELAVYTKTLDMLHKKKEHKLVLAAAYPVPILKFGEKPPILCDLEFYHYTRATAIFDAYSSLLENELNTALQIDGFESVISEILDYFNLFETAESTIPSVNERIIWHRYVLYNLCGQACYKAAELKKSARVSISEAEELKRYLRTAAHAFEQTIQLRENTLRVPFVAHSPELTAEIMNNLPMQQLSLLTTYCTLGQIVPAAEKNDLAHKARLLCHELKQQHHEELYQKAVSVIDLLEQSHDLNRRKLMPVASERIEKERAKKEASIEAELVKKQNKLLAHRDDSNKLNLKLKITTLQLSLESLLGSSESNLSQKLLNGILEIENEVRNAMGSEEKAPSLESVYENIRLILGGEWVIDKFWRYIVFFINSDISGDLERGVHRAEILKEMEITQRGEASYKSRFLVAALKNLMGQHDEWLALEKELIEKDAQKKRQKKEAKQKSIQEKAEALRFIQEQVKKDAEKKGDKASEPSAARPIPSAPKLSEPSKDVYHAAGEPKVDEKQRKLEKQQRHTDAETKRAKDEEEQAVPAAAASSSPSSSTSTEKKLSKEEQRELILLSSDKTLAEIYNLTSRPLHVDLEIEQNTWRFTREEFETYLKAMNCDCKSGKGVHTKGAIPKATHVMQGDNLISIMNEFGGALTLPAWDKDFVPFYLRKQILEARKNLRALKIIEIQACEKPRAELKPPGRF